MPRRQRIRTLCAVACVTFACLGRAQSPQTPKPEDSTPTFGTTVVVSSGLRGDIYLLPVDTQWLPNFKHLKPIGTIYTTQLNIPPTYFQQGFPGVTSRYEWFAIDYTGSFWIEDKGVYRFGLSSDDGSKLYLDGRLAIDNDGQHPPSGCTGTIELSHGAHSIRLSYFQGPRFEVCLMLGIAKPGQRWQVFDTRRFTPPANSPHWTSPGAATEKAPKGELHRGSCWAR